MPDWATFAAFAGLVTSALLLLSHASRGVISDGDDDHHDDQQSPSNAPDPPTEQSVEWGSGVAPAADTRVSDSSETLPEESDAPLRRENAPQSPGVEQVRDGQPSTALLLVNVAVSQGLFGVLLLAGAWFSDVPAWAFGAGLDAVTPRYALVGVGFGIALYAANELGSAVGERFGLGGGEELREALAPDTLRGWAVLLFGVLPIIAGFEELLFRGALVGVVSAGFDVSPWAMAVVSSVAFALGHGAQGRVGVVVTGLLGFVLAAGFVLTGSLLVVFVAHYLVNALEFVVHEGFAERTA